jgi:hypothetical protein
MTKQGMDKNQKKWTGRIGLIFGAGFILFLCGPGFCQGNDWDLFSWKLNLEELNRVFKEKYKTGQIQEDKHRTEIEFQYSPNKSVKVNRGELMALTSSTDPSTSGRLFGYAYEGKFFGRVLLFKDHPEFFPESINNRLKETYPQGRVYRSFGTTRSPSIFEFKSDKIYVFTTEKGIFFYEPNLLEEVARKLQGQADDRLRRYDEEWRNKPVVP